MDIDRRNAYELAKDGFSYLEIVAREKMDQQRGKDIMAYDRESAKHEPDFDEPPYDPSHPISIFNHPPFAHMSLVEFGELGRSFP